LKIFMLYKLEGVVTEDVPIVSEFFTEPALWMLLTPLLPIAFKLAIA